MGVAGWDMWKFNLINLIRNKMKLILFSFFLKLIVDIKATRFENFKAQAYDIFATVVYDAVVFFFKLASETYKDCKLLSAALRRIVHVPSRTASMYEILSTLVGVTECPRKGAAVALNGNLEIF
jgi:hypothetical protein